MWVAEGIARGSDSGEEPEGRRSDSTDWPRNVIDPPDASSSSSSSNNKNHLITDTEFQGRVRGFGFYGAQGRSRYRLYVLDAVTSEKKSTFDKEQPLP